MRDDDRDGHRREGERRRDAGVERAARRRRRMVWRGQLRLIAAILRDGTGTTDDAVRDLDRAYADGGRWRGGITLGLVRLGLVRCVGYVPSARPSRHAGRIAEWEATDPAQLRGHADILHRRLAETEDPERSDT